MLMQYTFRYGLYGRHAVPLALSTFEFFLLVLSTILIAAGGYVINNICDVSTDRINKPTKVIVGQSISEKAAYNIYMALTIGGVLIGLYLSNAIYKSSFLAIFIIMSATLYMYSTNLKQMPVVGNVLVALMLSISILILPIFDLLPNVLPQNQSLMSTIFQILLDYSIIAFIINLIREMVKDIEDVDGDYNSGMNTLPIIFGKARIGKVVFFASFIPVILIAVYVYRYLSNLLIADAFIMFFVIAPLIFFTIKSYNATTKADYKMLGNVLKVVILFGILSVWAISLNITHNASKSNEAPIQISR